VFYWKSPDGSKVLTQLRTGKYRTYTSARAFLNAGLMETVVPDLLRYYESMGARYPYDAILLQIAFDNTNPQLQLVDNIRAWNQKHSNPQVSMATPTEFFQDLEERYSATIPEFSGDITSAWTDDPGIYAQATGMKRRAVEEILAAEKFATLVKMLGSDRTYPRQAVQDVYKKLLIYTDHTYGMDNWNWEHWPLQQSGGDINHPIFDYYKESWEDKKEFAYDAARDSDQILGDSLEAVAAKIPADGPTIAVFNSLSWPRTDVVRILIYLHRQLKIAADKYYEIVDTGTGEKVPYQSLGGSRTYETIAFVAKNVPALGYKTYRVVPVSEAPRFPEGTVTLKNSVLENEFYRVQVDPETGGLLSLFDKELGRELVDTKGSERVNQYLYYSLTGSHEAIYQDHHPGTHEGRVPTSWYNIGIYSPMVAKVEVGMDGPAAKSLRSKMRMHHGPAPTEITQEVILYPGVKRVDFVNRLHKKETLNKEEVYYAFPFDVPKFRMHCELPGAVLEPHRDQLSGSFTGFSGIQHWADVSNQDFGVAVATREVPAIEFGEIRTNEWSLEYQPKRSAFFFYVMNNKENTNGAFWQGSESWRLGFLELNFAVTSHRGDWRAGKVTRFGWEHNVPLVARVIAAPQSGPLSAASGSFCKGLPEHVILQALKQTEDGQGYAARFYETEGKSATVAWSGPPVKVREAFLTDLAERPLRPAKLEDQKIVFDIGPYQLVTVRFMR
jgi:alpha-mannosidase